MLKRRLAVLGMLWLGFMGVSHSRDGNIRHADFEDFNQGTLGNAGANLYVSRKGTVQVINQWDLNRDGYVDLVLSNTHDNMSVVDALVYWGSADGPRSLLPELWRERPLAQVVYGLMDRTDQVTRLASFGGGRSAVADLNQDGYPDLVFCNYIHNYPGVRTAYVYWGSRDGYSPDGRVELPTRWAAGVVARDLNSDGYPDLVFANQGVEAGAEKISPKVDLASYIYWGSANGFDPDRPGLVPTRGARDVASGDVNGDGDPDLIFINNSPQSKGVQVFLGRAGRLHRRPLLGGGDGSSRQCRVRRPGPRRLRRRGGHGLGRGRPGRQPPPVLGREGRTGAIPQPGPSGHRSHRLRHRRPGWKRLPGSGPCPTRRTRSRYPIPTCIGADPRASRFNGGPSSRPWRRPTWPRAT